MSIMERLSSFGGKNVVINVNGDQLEGLGCASPLKN